YFEWHRALPAIANGATILTEPSDNTDPLRPGIEFVEAPTADLSAYLLALLANEDRRRGIARAAEARLRRDNHFLRRRACLHERLAQRRRSQVGTVRATSRSHAHVMVMERVRAHLEPRSGSRMPVAPQLDDGAILRFALKRSLLQQRQLLNLTAGRGVHASDG